MKSLIKLGTLAALTLTVASCDPWFNEDYRYSILQILHNNSQPNTVYNKTTVHFSGYNFNSVYIQDSFEFHRNIQPGDTAQIFMQDMYRINLYGIDTVDFTIELNDSQQFQSKFTRRYIRDPYQSRNDFVETIRF